MQFLISLRKLAGKEGGKTEFIKTKNCAQIEGNIEISKIQAAQIAFSDFPSETLKMQFQCRCQSSFRFSLFKHTFIPCFLLNFKVYIFKKRKSLYHEMEAIEQYNS